MGFVILIALGAVLGWIAAIIAGADAHRGTPLRVGVGVLTALVAGAIAHGAALLAGLSGGALVASIAGTITALAGLHLART